MAASVAERTTTIVRADEKTGHLVRSVVVEPHVVDRAVKPVAAPTAPLAPPADTAELIALIDSIAAEQGVEDSLVHSVIRAESNYNARAVSPKGAEGIMQLIPSTAKRFGVGNPFDVRENVLGGVKYLKFLLDYYHDDYVRAIAAYNAGEGAVDRYHGVPPYSETRNYLYTVARNLKTARETRGASKSMKTTKSTEAPAPVETYKRIETSVGSDGRVYYRTP